MIEKDDWRLFRDQIKYLYEAHLVYHRYFSKRDHDHCEFCMETFGFSAKYLHIGYSTKDSNIWICEKCYNDFRETFKWRVDE